MNSEEHSWMICYLSLIHICIKALKELRKNNISTSVITSINKENICELEELYHLLSDLGVNSWQLQIALPMGNFAKRPEWLRCVYETGIIPFLC